MKQELKIEISNDAEGKYYWNLFDIINMSNKLIASGETSNSFQAFKEAKAEATKLGW